MKKRIASTAILLLMIVLLLAQTALAAQTKASGAPTLSFSGTTAVCKAFCMGSSSDTLSATLTLYQGSTRIASWSGSGTYSVSLSGTQTVSSGKTYRLVLSYSVNGTAMPTVSSTGTCP